MIEKVYILVELVTDSWTGEIIDDVEKIISVHKSLEDATNKKNALICRVVSAYFSLKNDVDDIDVIMGCIAKRHHEITEWVRQQISNPEIKISNRTELLLLVHSIALNSGLGMETYKISIMDLNP